MLVLFEKGGRVKRWVAVVLVVLAAAGGGDDPDTAGGAAPTPPVDAAVTAPPDPDCPALPEGSADGGLALWPAEEAGDLVPDIPGACETPTTPALFALLNENAGWSSEGMEAAGLGVLHRGTFPLAPFLTVELKAPIQDCVKSMKEAGLATTEVGELTFAWGSAGGHVSVAWQDGTRFVSLSAVDAGQAAYAVAQWMGAAGGGGAGVTLPPKVPEVGDLAPAIAAGAPMGSLPQGYVSVPLDPIAFGASDFADSVTIHKEGAEALGAAIVVNVDNAVVGTVVAGVATSELRGTGEDLQTQGVPAAGFSVDEVSAFVAGYDQAAVDALVDAWEANLGG